MTARRFVAVAALATAAAAGLAAGPAQAADFGHHDRALGAHVRISQVRYDSPGRDDRSNRSLNAEWVRITNGGYRPVDLAGWTLSDADGHRYRFGHLHLGVRESVRVHTGYGRDSRSDVYQDRRAYVWNNDRDVATLRDARGRLVDHESWGLHRRH